jgi:ribosome-binding protein aMBF1 (putative translation factor)
MPTVLERPEQVVRERERILAQAAPSRQEYLEGCATIIDTLSRRGDWQGAVKVAVEWAGLSQADIARELEVMRSTVSRWLSGKTEPPREGIPDFGRQLQEMVRHQEV